MLQGRMRQCRGGAPLQCEFAGLLRTFMLLTQTVYFFFFFFFFFFIIFFFFFVFVFIVPIMRKELYLVLCFLYNKLSMATRTCYWPDGSVIPSSSDYTPCNLTATGIDSACCSSWDPCSANGYCFSSSGYVYRGGCTDSTWGADECCPNCRNGTESINPPPNPPPPNNPHTFQTNNERFLTVY